MILNQSRQKNLADLGVEALYLFGSRAQKKENSLSDYDYAVLMPDKGYSSLF